MLLPGKGMPPFAAHPCKLMIQLKGPSMSGGKMNIVTGTDISAKSTIRTLRPNDIYMSKKCKLLIVYRVGEHLTTKLMTQA